MALAPGMKAPEFTLHDVDRKERSLKEYLGKKTLLAFFPAVFTSICTKELCLFRDTLSSFEGMDAHVIAICVDAPASNKAFAQSCNLNFPILSDYSRTAIRAYDVVHDGFGGMNNYQAAKRAVFVLDRESIIRYCWIADHPGLEPPYDEVNHALALIS